MEEDGEDLSSPFWLPTSGNKRRRNDRIRHGLSSLIFNSGLLILLLLVAALSFLIFVVPSTLSFSAPIFKPNSVKKSWDSLNLILVLVALLLGFLSRNKNEVIVPEEEDDGEGFQASTPVIRNGEASKSNQLPSPHKWYDYSDQNRSVYSSSVPSRDMFLRTSSSYPDLRQVPSSSSPQMEFSDDPWRFSDDINWATGTGQFLRRRSWKDKDKSDDVTGPVRFSDDIYWGTGGTGHRLPSWKEKTADIAGGDKTPTEISSREVDVSSLIPPPTAPPLPPPLPVMTSALPEEKPKRTNGNKRGRNRRRKDIEMESMEPISPVVTASPPPPPPPPMPQFVDPKSNKNSLKKRSGGSTTKDFLNSLYHNKKKKKQRQKSVDNFDPLVVNRYQQPPSPPPPPPLPPPPPVSPPVSFNRSARKRKDAAVISASSGTTTSRFLTVAVNVPPKAVAVSNYYGAEESGNSGGESPVIHIPPPPPPPPTFSKSLAWKFALQGDYVRVDSTASSRSVSPEPYDADSDRTPMAGDGGDATPMTTASSLFCPSPDVDTKADKFISNFWAGLKLEKINSLKKKQGLGLSNLGPGSGPTQ